MTTINAKINTSNTINSEINPSSKVVVAAVYNGELTGTASNNTSFTGTTSLVNLGVSGNVGIGTASPSQKLDVVGNVLISGNLQVNGITTTVNQTNLDVSDNIIGLNRGASSNANDSGIIIERGSTGDNAAILWDESADKFVLGTTASDTNSTGNITIATGNLDATLTTAAQPNITSVGNLTGLNTSGSILADGTVTAATGSFNTIQGALSTAAQTNITSVGTLTGLVMGGTLNMGGQAITSAGNISGSTLSGTIGTAAQSNITSVGTLTSATVTGDLTVDTNTLKVDSTNNRVGIGISAPLSKLHIRDSSNGNLVRQLRISNENENSGTGAGIIFNMTQLENPAVPYVNAAIDSFKDSQRSGNLVFSTRETNTGGNDAVIERMRINGSGEVGIGKTATAGVELDVQGDIAASGSVTGATLVGTLSTAAQPNITSVGTLTSATITGGLTVDTTTLKVDSTNNRVGIGTASPSQKLEVVGNIKVSGTNPSVKLINDPSSNGDFLELKASNGSVSLSASNESGGGLGAFLTSGINGTPSDDVGLNAGTGTLSLRGDAGITAYDNVAITGNLTVNGTTTTVNQTNLDVSDNIIGLNRGASTNANDSGIIIERGSTGDNAAILWDESGDKFVLGTTASNASSTGNLTIATGNLDATLTTAAQPNITSVGTLTSATITGDLTVDTNTLKVDSTNNRVGINVSAPTEALDVNGNILSNGVIKAINNTQNVAQLEVGRDTNNQFLDIKVSDADVFITANQDTDSNGDHHFILDRSFLGSGGNDFEIRKGGTAQVTVNTNGNVGIGTTAPADELTVRGAQFNKTHISIGDNTDRLRLGYIHSSSLESSTAAAQIGSSSSRELKIAAPSNNSSSIKLYTNAADGAPTERMVIDNSGNVGIGTNSPDSKLQIVGGNLDVGKTSENVDRKITIHSQNASHKRTEIGYTGTVFGIRPTIGNQSMVFGSASVNDVLFSSDSGTGILRFNTATSERMRIDAAGNVGIGVVDPKRQLHVKRTGGGSVVRQIRIHNDTTSAGTGSGIEFGNTSGEEFVSASIDSVRATSSAASGNLVFSTRETNTGGDAAVIERMRIDPAGNVGIGTTAPNTKLFVDAGATNSIATFKSSDDKAVIQLKDNDTDVHLIAKDNKLSIGNSTSDFNKFNVDITNGNTIVQGNITSSSGSILASSGNFTIVSGTCQTAAQPNITSVGTLAGLNVSSAITSTNANLNVTANGGNLVLTANQGGSGGGAVSITAGGTFALSSDNIAFSSSGLNISAASGLCLAINDGSGGTDFINGNISTGKFDVQGVVHAKGYSLNANTFTVVSTTSTLAASTNGLTVILQNTGPITITLPTLAAGHVTTFVSETIHGVTFIGGSGITVNSFAGANTTAGQFAQCQVIYKTTAIAFLGGNLS